MSEDTLIDLSIFYEDDNGVNLSQKGCEILASFSEKALEKIEVLMEADKKGDEEAVLDTIFQTRGHFVDQYIRLKGFFRYFPPVINLESIPNFKEASPIVLDNGFIFI